MLTFLMIGQSNMAGRGVIGEMPAITNSRVLAFRESGWEQAREPVNPDRVFAGESLQIAFGDEVQKKTGETVGLIPCAEGGTLLYQWAPGEDLFRTAVARAARVNREHPLSAILWVQGENDGYSRENALSYGDRFLAMIGEMKRQIPVPGELPVYAAELCHFLERYNEQVAEEKRVPYFRLITNQIRTLPEKDPSIRCISSEGLAGKEDGIHYDTASLRILGHRFAKAFLEEYGKEKA